MFTPNLSILQSKLNHVFQLVYAKKKPAHGFVRGRSILTNAAPHAGKRWVLNVDLKDFFPSINFGRVRGTPSHHLHSNPGSGHGGGTRTVSSPHHSERRLQQQ